jgi:2-haloacid dehalogenase
MGSTASRPDTQIDAVVFDLGAVLIDWDARYLYRSLLPDDAAIDAFLDEIDFAGWNETLDAGGDWDAAVERLSDRHPKHAALIAAFRDRWVETVGEPIAPVLEVLRELVDAGVRTFALSNWSRRTFDIARSRFPFLDWFEGIVISGDEGVTKPDPRIYRALLERYRLDPATTVFIDDRRRNVETAEALGMTGVVLTEPHTLRATMRSLGLPLRPVAA